MLSEKHMQFYRQYAGFIDKALRKPLFQKFLNWIIKRENIKETRVEEIQVRILPFRKKNGNLLAGRWSKGKIFIFPKSLGFLRKKMQDWKKEKIRFYMESRAKATLIHELLHTKYHNEEKVRKLTKKYFNIFIQKQNTETFKVHSVLKTLFPK